MKVKLIALLALSSALSACGDSAPSGQVLATVDGEEITAADLSLELGGMKAPTAAQQKQLEIAALQSIVNRLILAKASAEEGADSTPIAAVVKRKAEQLANIQLLEQKLGAAVPNPSPEEAQQYINDHPASFAQRRIYLVEQIIVPNPPQSLIDALKPIETMAGVQAELAKFNVEARPTMGVIDAITIAPEAAAQIAGLAPDAVFIVPGQGNIRINRVRESQLSPITGAESIAVATNLLRRQRGQRQVGEAMQRFLREGQGDVQYNPEYDPATHRPPQQRRGAPAGGGGATPAPARQPAPAAPAGGAG